MKSLTNDEFISAFQEHHGEQMAAVQTYGKFQGSGEYWDEFRRRLTVASAADAVIAAAKEFRDNCKVRPKCSGCTLETICEALDNYREVTKDE